VARGTADASWIQGVLEDIEAAGPQRFVPLDPLKRRSFRPIDDSSMVRLSRVTLDRGSGPARLEWDAFAGPRGAPEAIRGLWSFVGLRDASDEQIAQVAGRWGPLGICACGLPSTHADGCLPLSAGDKTWQQEMPSDSFKEWLSYWEPTEAWRFYSRQFAAILAIAATAAQERPTPPRQILETLDVWPERRGPRSVPNGTAFERFDDEEVRHLKARFPKLFNVSPRVLVAGSVTRLIRHAGIYPHLTWRDTQKVPRLEYSLGGLSFSQDANQTRIHPWRGRESPFAFLVAQLAAVVQRPDGIGRCEQCDEVVEVLRRDQAHYCPIHKEEVKHARWRERSKNKRLAQRQIGEATTAPRYCARPGCDQPLSTAHKRRRYCSDNCRVREWQARRKPIPTPTDTPTRMNSRELM
jgi:hypothetical protein